MIFINPNSGPGQSKVIYETSVKPILVEADVPHEVIITERSNHAYEFVKNMDLNTYSGIIIISGDGLVYEVSFIKVIKS